MYRPVSIPPNGDKMILQEASRETFLLYARQFITGLLQKRSFGGDVIISSGDISAGYVDVVFTTPRLEALYIPEAFVMLTGGGREEVDIDFATITENGFRVYIGSQMTAGSKLYWKIIPYE
jgi:hypothetical protein